MGLMFVRIIDSFLLNVIATLYKGGLKMDININESNYAKKQT